MTISSTTRIAGPFTGTGVATTFPFSFKVFQASDLYVVKLTVSTSAETVLTLNTDYTVTLNGNQDSNPGGNVILPAVLASGYTLTISSDIANLQPTDLTNQGGFYPEVITDALDRACIQIQQLASLNTRSLVAPISDGLSTSLALPAADLRANKYLAFDANGVPMAADGTDTPNITSAGNMTITANNAGSNVARDVIFYDNATETMRILGSGSTSKVGIGISAPASRLHVHESGATNCNVNLTNGTSGSTATDGLLLRMDTVGQAFVYNMENAPLLFGTNATEKMQISAGGNVGIGTTNPASKLDVNGIVTSNRTTAGSFIVSGDGAYTFGTDIKQYIYGKPGNDGNVAIYTTTAAGATNDRLNVTSNLVQVKTPLTTTSTATIGDTLTVSTGGLTVISGNVGIGTNSPGSLLDVAGGQIRFRSTGAYSQPSIGTGAIYYDADTGNLTLDARAPSGSTALLFRTSNGGTGAERMRITSAGEVFIAGTTDQGAYNLQCNGTGVWGAGAYTNGSDSRIKHDINPIGPCLDLVSAIQPVTFIYNSDWSSDQTVQTGFIAQQLQTALAGQEYLDGIVSQGGEYLNVAYQNIIPLLTKSIQELKAIVDAQAARIAALEANA